MERSCKNCQQRRVGCHANCERYKADCAQDAKRRAYEKQIAYLDSMPQTATALKKTLAPRRVGGHSKTERMESMTRKKCIKMIMGTMGVPQPWEAEKVFRATREWMYGETGPWPSNQEVLMVILSAMAKDVAIGIPLKTYFLARVRLLIIRAKLKRIHDRLMGGPAKETQA